MTDPGALLEQAAGLVSSRPELAERFARDVLARQPGNARAHTVLADSLDRREILEEGLAEADEALRLDAGSAYAYSVRASIRRKRAQTAEAEQDVFAALRLAPRHAPYFALHAAILQDRRKYKEALEATERGLAIDPGDDMLLRARASTLLMLGRRSEAGRVVDESLMRTPDRAQAHGAAAYAAWLHGELDLARDEVSETLRLDPTNRIGQMIAASLREITIAPGYQFGWWWFPLSRQFTSRRMDVAALLALTVAGVAWPGAWFFAAWLGAMIFVWSVDEHLDVAAPRILRLAVTITLHGGLAFAVLLGLAGAASVISAGMAGLAAFACGAFLAPLGSLIAAHRRALNGAGCLVVSAFPAVLSIGFGVVARTSAFGWLALVLSVPLVAPPLVLIAGPESHSRR